FIDSKIPFGVYINVRNDPLLVIDDFDRAAIRIRETIGVVRGVVVAVEVPAVVHIRRHRIDGEEHPDPRIVIALLHVHQPRPHIAVVAGVAGAGARGVHDLHAVGAVVHLADYLRLGIGFQHRAAEGVGVDVGHVLGRGPEPQPAPGTPRIPAPRAFGYSVPSPHQDGPRGVMNESAEITEWLAAARQGDKSALDRVLATLYRELHGMARRQLGGQQQGHTLDTTALVHEAYLKLAGRAEAEFEDRAHFFAYAASAMRSVVVDYARQRMAVKRGGDLHRVTDLPEDAGGGMRLDEDMLGLDVALNKLHALDPRLAQVVEMR